MIYKPKIKVNGVEIEMGGGTSTSPFLSCAELSDVVSKSGLEIGAAAASCLKVTITNPYKASFDGDKVELYISEIDDGNTTTKERIEEEVGDTATTELIDISEEAYTDEPDEEEGEPLTGDEITEIETYSNELEELQIKFFEGDPMAIVDIETAEEKDPEWELFGTFYVRSQTSSADAVILTCYDNISRLNMQYSQAETPKTFAEHWAAIKAELAEYGIPLDDFENSNTTPLQFLPLTTMRDALSLLTGYAGGFLACAPDGSLGISFYGFAGEILIRDDLLSISDTSSGEIIVDAVECENTRGEIITAGGGGQAVKMSNYLVTREALESVIVPLYRGTRYTGGALSCPWSRELTAGEFIRVMTAEEYRNYLMLLNSEEDTRALRSSLGQVFIISSQTVTFGGTATTVIYSACDSETAKAQYTQAPLKKQIIQTDKKAEDAAHTATDFIAPQTTLSTDDGIKVFPKAEKNNPKNYTQINQNGVGIYQNGSPVASFGANKIELGKGNPFAEIDFCGGQATIENIGMSTYLEKVESLETGEKGISDLQLMAGKPNGGLNTGLGVGSVIRWTGSDGEDANIGGRLLISTLKNSASANLRANYSEAGRDKSAIVTCNVTGSTSNITMSADSITINGEPLADFVVERGTWNNYEYEKWHSGICECWTKRHQNTGTLTMSALGNLYLSATVQLDFPTHLFSDLDNINITFGFSSAGTYLCSAMYSEITKTNKLPVRILKGGSSTSAVGLVIRAKGKWK